MARPWHPFNPDLDVTLYRADLLFSPVLALGGPHRVGDFSLRLPAS